MSKQSGSTESMARDVQEYRCPYCTDRDEFRLMAALPDGSLRCESCGHAGFPSDSTRECICLRCQRLRRAATNFLPINNSLGRKSRF